ncbi:MAG TPA: ABC transporter substrate-binding protein [Chloroflexota bacterium]
MAKLSRVVSVILASSLLVVAAAACGGGATPAATTAPAKPAAEPTKAAAPAAQPTSAAPAAAPAAAKPTSGEIVIGWTPPVTGASAAEGALQIKAINLAAKQINAAGGVNGKAIKLVTEDNQSSNPGALAALQKAVEQDKALAIMGVVKSTQVLAMSDAIKGYGIPFVMGGTNATLTSAGNPWLFRVRPDDSIAAAAMVKYIKEDMKLTKVGILHDTDAFGTGGADLVEKGSKDAGMTVVKREKYTTKDKDFTAQLLSLKNAGAEVMVVYGTNPEDVAVIQRQYVQLGKPFKYVGSPSSQMKDALNLSKENSEGLIAIADYVPGATAENKAYAADYKKEYNEEFDPTSAWTYDGLKILTKAIGTAGEDKGKIKDAILATQGYKGVLGTFNFSKNGDGLHEVSVVQINKNAWDRPDAVNLLKVVNVQ